MIVHLNCTLNIQIDIDFNRNCQYHIVFTPKYRRKAIYAKLRADIGKYIRRLCVYKCVEIVEAHAMPDHIHTLVKIPPKLSVSSFMGYKLEIQLRKQTLLG